MFTPTPEQEQLRGVLRSFFARRSPDPVVRRTMELADGYDPALWREMACDLGLLGMGVPESLGGSGYTYAESCLVMEEAGAAMVCAPLLSTLALTVNALLHAVDERSCARLLPLVVNGSTHLTVVLPGQGKEVEAVNGPHGWVLRGVARGVLDGALADRLLVAAKTDSGMGVFEVDARGAGIEREALATLDLTRRAAVLTFNSTPAMDVSGAEPVDQTTDRIRDLAAVGLACEQVGGAQAALDASVAYASARFQFSRPIGSFQAVKHRLADMLVAVETARSAAYEAVDAALSGNDHSLAVAAAVAGSHCSESYSYVAEEAIQVHGGLGFTWEHSAHLWFRRAKADALLVRSPSQHRLRLAELIA